MEDMSGMAGRLPNKDDITEEDIKVNKKGLRVLDYSYLEQIDALSYSYEYTPLLFFVVPVYYSYRQLCCNAC